MRLALVAPATVALVLAFAPCVRAQDGEKKEKEAEKKTEPRLPINPFAKAKKGDWSVLVATMKAEGKEEKADDKMTMVFRVTDVDGDKVTVSVRELTNDDYKPKPKVGTFSTKEAPAFRKFIEVKDKSDIDEASDKISDWKVEDAKKTVGGKEIACKKVTFKMQDGQQLLDGTLWLSEETKGWGLIGLSLKGKTEGGGAASFEFELVSYGHGDKPDFGKTPEAHGDKETAKDASKKDK